MILLGIGSNLKDPLTQIRKAIQLLRYFHIEILQTSSLYKTKPWGFKNQPPFYNLLVEVHTALLPASLLEILQLIESILGRERLILWGPRIIDLDILLYRNLFLQTPRLQIPHPYLCERPFWLIPLLEMNPHLCHPVTKKNFKDYPAARKNEDILAIYPSDLLFT